MDKKTVYRETSIVSYLTARPSDNLLAAAWQKVTVDWWETQRSRFTLYISAVVLEEAGRGDSNAIERRIKALEGIPLLEANDEVRTLSKILLTEKALPPRAVDDSLHIALSAVHGIDFLLTWNCRHIDNAETKPLIRNICFANGYNCPEICTPQEFMGVTKNG